MKKIELKQNNIHKKLFTFYFLSVCSFLFAIVQLFAALISGIDCIIIVLAALQRIQCYSYYLLYAGSDYLSV